MSVYRHPLEALLALTPHPEGYEGASATWRRGGWRMDYAGDTPDPFIADIGRVREHGDFTARVVAYKHPDLDGRPCVMADFTPMHRPDPIPGVVPRLGSNTRMTVTRFDAGRWLYQAVTTSDRDAGWLLDAAGVEGVVLRSRSKTGGIHRIELLEVTMPTTDDHAAVHEPRENIEYGRVRGTTTTCTLDRSMPGRWLWTWHGSASLTLAREFQKRGHAAMREAGFDYRGRFLIDRPENYEGQPIPGKVTITAFVYPEDDVRLRRVLDELTP